MKHKRMAILFVVVTFAGSPPVWQKLSNFVSAIQHKAQIKFLSMVLRPAGDEAEVREMPVIEEEHVASRSNVDSQVVPQNPTSQAASKIRRLVPNRNDARATMAIEKAAKEARVEALSHMNELLPETPRASTVSAVAAIPRALTLNESDVRDLMRLSQRGSSAPVFVDGTNPSIQLKLKKILDERKGNHQRSRFVIASPHVAPPAPRSEMPDDDRSG